MIQPIHRLYNLINLKEVTPKLKNLEYFIFYGTLLGYHREKNLIRYDDDIDFYINIQHRDQLNYILEEVGFTIGYHSECFVQGIRKIGDKTTYVDFYCYDNDETSEFIRDRWNFKGNYHNFSTHLFIDKDWVFPILEGNIDDLSFKIPNNPEECCIYLYGEDYRIPLDKDVEYITRVINNQVVREKLN